MVTSEVASPSQAAAADAGAVAPLAIYYEHPVWFERLFAELERRGTPFQKIDALTHRYDPTDLAQAARQMPVLFNRMSPSAYRRSHSQVFYTLHYLTALEQAGVRVINGARAFRHETSKALQLSLLHALELPAPRSRVIHDAAQAVEAAAGLRYPIVVKPNVGGSGAGVRRYDSPAELARATAEPEQGAGEAGRGTGAAPPDLGLDHVALVQEFIPPRGGHITRLEVVGGKFLYGIKVHLSGQTFDLCPADICRTTAGVELGTACAVEAPKAGLRVEGFTPAAEIVASAERIMRHAGIDVGGIEYLIDDRDGQLYFYDINALSNFVSDGPRVVGFDPFVPLADYLRAEMEAHHAT